MTIATPCVAVISSPFFTENQESFLRSQDLSWVRDPVATPAENLIEFAGRICYMSFGYDRQKPGSNANYISRLISSGHDSVLEHAVWSLLITGITRSFTHQLVRHRAGFSYSQLSQQYHDESEADFLMPNGLSTEAASDWTKATAALRALYNDLKKIEAPRGLSKREALRYQRSVARSILPNATETCIVVSANARSFRHFLDVRGSTSGDIEMRLVSRAMFDKLCVEAPAVFADFATFVADDGWPIVRRRVTCLESNTN